MCLLSIMGESYFGGFPFDPNCGSPLVGGKGKEMEQRS